MASRRTRLALLSVTLLAMVAAAAAGPVVQPLAAGPDIRVTTTADLPPDGVLCVSTGAQCSLRAAVAVANGSSDRVIRVPTGQYVLGSRLILSAAMSIAGEPGPAPVIDANHTDRVFTVDSAVTLERLRITNGRTSENGGGIMVSAGASLILRDSTVDTNEAGAGGGLYVEGSATVTGSTFTLNQASGKGGGIFDDGSLAVTNSTLVGNVAGGGGAIASSGTTTVSFATVTGNTSTNKNGGGLYRVGGSFTVTGSIIAGNTTPNQIGHDCYGSPLLEGPNLVGNDQGCNPKGTEPLVVRDPGLGPLADNGGPTLTRAVLMGSPAKDYAGLTCPPPGPNSSTSVDQRGAPRPGGLGCDVGAYELVPLSLEVALTTDLCPATNPQCVPDVRSAVASLPQPGVGTSSHTSGGGGTASTQLGAIQLGAIEIGASQLGAIQLGASQLGAIQLGAIDFTSTQLGAIQLGAIEIDASQLGAIALSALPVEGGWDALLAGTEFAGIPLTSLTLAQVSVLPQVQALTLEQLGLTATQLGAIQLGAIQLGAIQLGAIQLGAIQLGAIQLGAIQLGAIQLGAIQLGAIQLSNVPVEGGWEALLAGTEFAGVPLQNLSLWDVYELPQVRALTLAQLDFSATQLGAIQLGAILLNTYPLAKLPLPGPFDGATTDAGRLFRWCEALGSAGCAAAGIAEYAGPTSTQAVGTDDAALTLLTLSLAGIDFSAVPVAGAPLADFDATSIASTQLGAIELRALANLQVVVDCGLYPALCSGAGTVADAAALHALSGTFGDLILGLIAPGELPWQDVDLTATAVAEIGFPAPQLPDPMFHYLATLTVGGVSANATASLSLPAQFAYVPGTATIDGMPLADCPAGTPTGPSCQVSRGAGPTITFALIGLAPGSHVLSLGSRAAITLGHATASISATATAGTETAPAGPATTVVNVVEAFELGDTATDVAPIRLGTPDLHLAHISFAGETDLFSFDVTPGQAAVGAQAVIALGNLDFDGDLVLYGPGIVPLRGQPLAYLTSVGDASLTYTRNSNVAPSETLRDIPTTLPASLLNTLPNPKPVVDAVSAHRGTRSEVIETGSLRPGRYYIQVSGYNGATSTHPFSLRTRLSVLPPLPTCRASTFGMATNGPQIAMPDAGAVQTATTVILVNEGRLRAAYGHDETDALIHQLLAFTAYLAADPSLGSAVVVPVDDDANVRAAYDRWDTAQGQCSVAAANDVVRAIGQLLDSVTTSATEYVVLIGGDAQLPMARIADGTRLANESSFGRSFITLSDGQRVGNPLVAALAAGNILTDDVYGAKQSIVVDGRELFVPTIALGRLVEHPAEIRAGLENFVTFGGTIAPDTVAAPALVTGYDFLEDGARLVADRLQTAGLPVTKLINPTWSNTELGQALLAASQAGPDATTCADTGCLVSLNAHFDERRALPAGGEPLFTTADLTAATKRTLLFSMGCHSGLSVDDIQIGVVVDDWAQVLSQYGANLAGNSGFGYGDTDTVALSEQLMATFAGQLPSTQSVGRALMLAKQLYLQGTPLLTAYDQKALQISTFYGLPMFRFSTSVAAAPQAVSASSTYPVGTISAADYGLTLSIGTSPGPSTLRQVTTARGNYYDLDGQTVGFVDRPIQPVARLDVAQPGMVAHGVLITGLTSIDLGAFDPVYFRPTVDESLSEPEPEMADTYFPASPVWLPPVLPGSPLGQSLVVVPGQFRDPVPGTGIGTQRLFTNLAATVFYGDTSTGDFMAPSIVSTKATTVGGVTTITVVVNDPDVADVLVLWRSLVDIGDAFGRVTWTAVHLANPEGDSTWTASIGDVPASGIQFFSQVRDTSGNVAASFNKGGDFNTAPAGSAPPVLVAVSGPSIVGGWYSGAVSVDLSGGQGTLYYSVDGSPFAVYTPGSSIVVTDDGAHIVEAMDSLGTRTATSFRLDAADPEVSVTASPTSTPEGWNGSAVTLTGTASDGAGSGIVSFAVEATGAGAFPRMAITGPIVVMAPGITVVTFTATDLVGRVTAVSRTVKIDTDAPLWPSPPDDGGWNKEDVAVSFSVSDAGAGVSQVAAWIRTGAACGTPPDGSLVPFATPVGSFNLPPVNVTSEGTTVVCAYARDAVGNESTTSTTVRIDLTGPAATINYASGGTAAALAGAGFELGQAVTLQFSCSDVLSGVAACVATVDGATVANGAALPTGSLGSHTVTVTATDHAGNQVSVSATYSVVYSVCRLWDTTKAFNGDGNTIPIKIQLCGPSGQNLSSPSITLKAVGLDNGAAPPNDAGNANDPNEFRYDPKLKGYIYNFHPPTPLAPGEHTMWFVITGDPSGHRYAVKFLTQ